MLHGKLSALTVICMENDKTSTSFLDITNDVAVEISRKIF
jgi:hypothetical protein